MTQHVSHCDGATLWLRNPLILDGSNENNGLVNDSGIRQPIEKSGPSTDEGIPETLWGYKQVSWINQTRSSAMFGNEGDFFR
jgi:hypothetical protein